MSSKILQNVKNPIVVNPELRMAIKIKLLELGLSERNLSRIIDENISHVNQVIRGLSNNTTTRAKIESALGQRFWGEESSNHDLQKNQSSESGDRPSHEVPPAPEFFIDRTHKVTPEGDEHTPIHSKATSPTFSEDTQCENIIHPQEGEPANDTESGGVSSYYSSLSFSSSTSTRKNTRKEEEKSKNRAKKSLPKQIPKLKQDEMQRWFKKYLEKVGFSTDHDIGRFSKNYSLRDVKEIICFLVVMKIYENDVFWISGKKAITTISRLEECWDTLMDQKIKHSKQVKDEVKMWCIEDHHNDIQPIYREE